MFTDPLLPDLWGRDDADQMDAACGWAEEPVQMAAVLQCTKDVIAVSSAAGEKFKPGSHCAWDQLPLLQWAGCLEECTSSGGGEQWLEWNWPLCEHPQAP